jgi:DNA-binding NarL/FixJ family response regulator
LSCLWTAWSAAHKGGRTGPSSSLRAIVTQDLVVILSFHDDPKTRARALSAGAIAFVGKQEPSEMLLTVIRHAVTLLAGRYSFDAA